jgi:hypothetical protein
VLAPYSTYQPLQFLDIKRSTAALSELTSSCSHLVSGKPDPQVSVLNMVIPVRLPTRKHRPDRNQAVAPFWLSLFNC